MKKKGKKLKNDKYGQTLYKLFLKIVALTERINDFAWYFLPKVIAIWYSFQPYRELLLPYLFLAPEKDLQQDPTEIMKYQSTLKGE